MVSTENLSRIRCVLSVAVRGTMIFHLDEFLSSEGMSRCMKSSAVSSSFRIGVTTVSVSSIFIVSFLARLVDCGRSYLDEVVVVVVACDDCRVVEGSLILRNAVYRCEIAWKIDD